MKKKKNKKQLDKIKLMVRGYSLSQQEFAKALGLKRQSQVSRRLNGDVKITIFEAKEWAKILKCDISDLQAITK